MRESLLELEFYNRKTSMNADYIQNSFFVHLPVVIDQQKFQWNHPSLYYEYCPYLSRTTLLSACISLHHQPYHTEAFSLPVPHSFLICQKMENIPMKKEDPLYSQYCFGSCQKYYPYVSYVSTLLLLLVLSSSYCPYFAHL